MKLFLLRHADANTEAANDDDRALSEKGKKQAQRVARFCERNDLKPALILASPLKRAQQTASALSDTLHIELETAPWLACGATPEGTLQQLAGRKLPSVVLVAHEPDMSLLVAHLLGVGSGATIHVRKASLLLLEVGAFRAGGGCLEWSIPVRMM
jgi:phosphohistidine phosphatase